MGQGIRCKLVSWSEVQRLTLDLARRLRADAFTPDIIVAIGRGGWVPGRLLSDYLDNPNLTELKVEHYRGTEKQAIAQIRYPLRADPAGQRVLLVDDVTDTGDSFTIALEHILGRGEPSELRTSVLHHKRVSPYAPDYFGQMVPEWRWIIYPWAVIEDLSALIRRMEETPPDAEAILERLLNDHDIRVPLHTVEDVLDLMSVQPNR